MPRTPRQAKWRRRMVIAALIAGMLYVMRGPVLRSVAHLLIVDDHTPPASALLIVDGDRRFDVAEKLHAGGAASILLYRRRPGRLERMGIFPQVDEAMRRELVKRHIAADDVALLANEPISRSQVPAALGDWLTQHPADSVAVICDRFSSRSWKWRIDRAVDRRLRERVSVMPVSRRLFDESNWWQSKGGVLAVIDAYFSLAFHLWRRDEEPAWLECSEADFRAAFAGVAVE